jgi:NADPH:quinone reductase-like Zn-dependent oxidoreductase
MGRMGREFDGGYAGYICVPCKSAGYPERLCREVGMGSPWRYAEMLQTAYGSLFKALKLKEGDELLVRAGTLSVGLEAAASARNHGVAVTGTTRKADEATAEIMRGSGMSEMIADSGGIPKSCGKCGPMEQTRFLELIGTTTLEDSLLCAKEGRVVCMSGIVGDKWTWGKWNSIKGNPPGSYLTAYNGGLNNFIQTPSTELVKQIMKGNLTLQIGKVLRVDEIVEAHALIELNQAKGKIMVLTYHHTWHK